LVVLNSYKNFMEKNFGSEVKGHKLCQ